MQRSLFVDYLKGTLILLVTIGHSLQFFAYHNTGFFSDGLFKAIYMFHMPMFISISGFLAYSSLQRSSFLGFLLQKTASYVLPIFVWAFIYKTATALVMGRLYLSELPRLIWQEAIQSQWFIWVLFTCLVIARVSYAASSRLFLITCTALIPVILALPEHGQLVMLKFMYPFFVTGLIIASVKIDRVKLSHPLAWMLAAAGTIACYAAWTTDTYVYTTGMSVDILNIPNVTLRLAGGLCGSFFGFLLLSYLHSITGAKIRIFIESMGRSSLCIYIIQGYIFIMASKVTSKLYAPISNHAWAWGLAAGLGILLSIFCFAIGRLISRSPMLGFLLLGKGLKAKNLFLTKQPSVTAPA